MQPIRADERVSSALVHVDMFRDLRDRGVVLADLSLNNLNVFYELGIRHVMAASGTVLICRSGSDLPFDVKLSRVIFYDYDGLSLDWDEVERVVELLKSALLEASKGHPDSPVHALLDTMGRQIEPNGPSAGVNCSFENSENSPEANSLNIYQNIVAEQWLTSGAHEALGDLIDKNYQSVFGARALAFLCLILWDRNILDISNNEDKFSLRIAEILRDSQQHRLAVILYEKLNSHKRLNYTERLKFASSLSESDISLSVANAAVEVAEKVIDDIKHDFGEEFNIITGDGLVRHAEARFYLAGLLRWRWMKGQKPDLLESAKIGYAEAIKWNKKARDEGVLHRPGFLAELYFKYLILLRMVDGGINRIDSEGNIESLLDIIEIDGDDKESLSYLGWYKAIAYADKGDAERSLRFAVTTRVGDSILTNSESFFGVGRLQYNQLRRFLMQFLPYMRHQSLIGRVSQELYMGNLLRPEVLTDGKPK